MRHGLAFCVCLLIVGEAAADIAPPFPFNLLPRKPRPAPRWDPHLEGPVQVPLQAPQPAPPTAVKTKTLNGAVTVVPLPKEKDGIVLDLPSDVVEKLKASLEAADPPRRTELGQPIHTAAAGIALSLGIVTGGLWLSRRGRSGWMLVGVAVFACLSTVSVIAWANPPPVLLFREEPTKQIITINVVEPGKGIRLHLPESMAPKTIEKR